MQFPELNLKLNTSNSKQNLTNAQNQRALLGHHAHRNSVSLPTSPQGGAGSVRFFSNRFSSTSSLESSSTGSSPNSSFNLGSRVVRETNRLARDVDESTGNKIINQYMILKELGRGVHGKVKLCKDMENGELVAIKIMEKNATRRGIGNRFSLHHRLSASSQPSGSSLVGESGDQSPSLGTSAVSIACMPPMNPHYEKIRKEIAILKKCNHPNVVALKEVIDDPAAEKTYLVLEFLAGGDVRWQQPLPDEEDPYSAVPVLTEQQSRKIFRDLVAGVEYLHYQGILHRDIKPANLLYTENSNSVKIGDFGVSCYIGKKRMMTSSQLYDRQKELESTSSIGSSQQGSELKLKMAASPVSSGFPDITTPVSATPRALSLDLVEAISPQPNASPSNSGTKRMLLNISKFRRSSQSDALSPTFKSKEDASSQVLSPVSVSSATTAIAQSMHFEEPLSYLNDIEDESTMVDDELELAKTAGSPAFFAPEMCGVVDDDPSWLESAAQFEEKMQQDELGRECYQRHSLRNESKSLIARHPILIGKAVDVWAMGVLLYCCVFGRVPFIGRSEFDLFNCISKETHTYPKHIPVDPLLVDLINKLLEKNPFKRITIPGIKEHPWLTADMNSEERALWLQLTNPAYTGLPLEVTDEDIKLAIKVPIIKRIKESIRRISTSLSMGFPFSRNSSSTVAANNKEPFF